MNKLELSRLRQLNCGYNPEKALDFGKVEILVNGTLAIVEPETEHVSLYYKTDCKNEIEFIKRYPKTYGVIYGNSFYILEY